jgi:DNA-binding IclR family transcriptional regulator
MRRCYPFESRARASTSVRPTSAAVGADMDELAGSLSNSAARAVAIVEFLALRPNETFTLSEISRFCGLRKSTAYTILRILHEAGWLTRSPTDLEYALGPTLITIGQAAEETRPEVNLARPVMQRLSVSLQRECVLSTTLGDEILILEVTGHTMRGRNAHPGHRVPLVAPYGTVFVAWQDRTIRDEWYAQSSIVSPEQIAVLERILDDIARRGYVVTLHSDPRDKMAEIMRAVSAERTIRDVRRTLKEQLAELPPVAYLLDDDKAKEKLPIESVQAPIFDSKGIARYALTIGNVDIELDPEAVARFGLEVRRAADEVTAALAVHFGQSQMRA